MTPHRFAIPAATVLLLLAVASANAASQKIFRCGPDGRVYSQTPCKNGYEVPAADARSPEQRLAAEEVVKREARLADKMARERRAAEAAAAKQGAAHIAYPAAAKPAAPAAAAASAAKKRTTRKPAVAAAAAASQP